jgi:hypothetical protein
MPEGDGHPVARCPNLCRSGPPLAWLVLATEAKNEPGSVIDGGRVRLWWAPAPYQRVARGRPFGGLTWLARTVRRLGHENTLRLRGRPRKSAKMKGAE